MKKELFLTTEHRRHGDKSDPFAEAAREERIRENEMYYDLRQKRPNIMQPMLVQPNALSAPPATMPLLGFQPTSGSAWNPQASTGSVFGGSSQPAGFGQTTTGFGQTTSTSAFGVSAAQSAVPFGTSKPSSGAQTQLFGQSGFGNANRNFSSPGSSVGTNFGASSVGASPNGRFGVKTGNKSL